ncbi:hypothetical protein FSP39_003943 [Pinctada imbricata]|uniref:RING-type domain-containing protein n=1 Tax=Pinctada imbricata TaxID=66713 RepID=A0AA88Y8X7_PINIB|nr:hypothetical protein FSP39_003943 [Pinctada imbricata]
MGQGTTKHSLDKGMKLYQEENFAGAISEWSNALKRSSLLLHSGRLNDAMDMCELSMKEAMRVGDRPVQGKCLFTFAEIHRKRKDYERSYPRYESAYSIFVEMGDRMNQLEVLHGMAKTMASLKDFQQALELSEKAAGLALDIGNKFGYLESKTRMVDLYRMLGNDENSRFSDAEVTTVANELELFCGVCGEQIGLIPEGLDPLPCGHLIHSRCVPHLARYTWGRKGRRRPCPSCRARSSGNPLSDRA